MGDHLDCEECGNVIDICPVGALTSVPTATKRDPGNDHTGTACAICGDGCKTTLVCAARKPEWRLSAATIGQEWS